MNARPVNPLLPVGADLHGSCLAIARPIDDASPTMDFDPDIIPAIEPLEGQAYHERLVRLYGSWDGDLFEPLDAPLDELGHLFE